MSVILTFTTAKGTTREHTSLTESRGELGMSAWLWKSKDVSLGAGQTQVQTPAPLLTPWDLVLSVGSPVARSISKPPNLVRNAESTGIGICILNQIPGDSYTR